MDKFYSFIFRGMLADQNMKRLEVSHRGGLEKEAENEIANRLPIDVLDSEHVSRSKKMATVFLAITAFERSVREFVEKTLLDSKGENWWGICVSEKTRKFVETRRKEEERNKWHSQRGQKNINYVELGDIPNIIQNNWAEFEPYCPNVEWVRAIFQDIEKTRNVIMHSGEVDLRDIERLGIAIRDWIQQVGA